MKIIKYLEEAKSKPFYRIKGNTPEKTLLKVEKLLGFKLSPEHRTFYKEVGYLSFSGFEFYGICNDRLKGKTALCAVETTLKERKRINLPDKWVLLSFFEDGYYGYLDYSDLSEDNEPSVIKTYYDGTNHNIIEKTSHSLSDYLIECLKK